MAHSIATFDGGNRIITLVSGITAFDIQDLYSEWKEFAISGSNLGFAPAFRTIGGDPLSAGIDAGAYFFIQNQASGIATGNWRLKPFEADATVTIAGNLVPEDSTFPIAVPTDGPFTVLLAGLQPITQNVDLLLVEIQDASYGDAVTVDIINGEPGTAFPVGTPTNPVDNIADARTIANNKNLKQYKVRSPVVLDQAHNNWVFIGLTTNSSVDLNNQQINRTVIKNCSVSGTNGENSSFRVEESTFFCVTNFQGEVINSILRGVTTLGSASEIINFIDCESGVVGTDFPSIDFVGPGRNVGIRGYVGGIELRNILGVTDNVSIDMLSGQTILANTCVSGTAVVRGIGHLTDLSAGTLVVTSGLVSQGTVSTAIWDHQTSDAVVTGSFGEFVSTKLLTLAKFIGLK